MSALIPVVALVAVWLGWPAVAAAQPAAPPAPAPAPIVAPPPPPTPPPALAPLPGPATPPGLPAGWYLTPSFGLSLEFDDNVFVSAVDKESDFITRFTPGLEIGYRSAPFTLLLSGSFDAEIYAKNTELSDEAVRKRAALHVRYLPYRLLTLGLDATYLETETPSDVVPTTGVLLPRRTASDLTVTPSVAFQLTSVDHLRGSYAFTRATLDDSPTTYVHRVRADYGRQLTALDTGTATYRLGVYDTEGFSAAWSHTVTAGWTRQLTPNTLLRLEGGPRLVDNEPVDDGWSLKPEAHGRIEHLLGSVGPLGPTRVALEYLRTEGYVVGAPGTVEIHALTAFLEIEPMRLLRVRFEPGYYRTFDGVFADTEVYGFLLGATYPITSWLTARAAYRFAYQKQIGPDISHNVVTVGLDIAYPIRVADWLPFARSGPGALAASAPRIAR